MKSHTLPCCPSSALATAANISPQREQTSNTMGCGASSPDNSASPCGCADCCCAAVTAIPARCACTRVKLKLTPSMHRAYASFPAADKIGQQPQLVPPQVVVMQAPPPAPYPGAPPPAPYPGAPPPPAPYPYPGGPSYGGPPPAYYPPPQPSYAPPPQYASAPPPGYGGGYGGPPPQYGRPQQQPQQGELHGRRVRAACIPWQMPAAARHRSAPQHDSNWSSCNFFGCIATVLRSAQSPVR